MERLLTGIHNGSSDYWCLGQQVKAARVAASQGLASSDYFVKRQCRSALSTTGAKMRFNNWNFYWYFSWLSPERIYEAKDCKKHFHLSGSFPFS
jgi:hypothetical protein